MANTPASKTNTANASTGVAAGESTWPRAKRQMAQETGPEEPF